MKIIIATLNKALSDIISKHAKDTFRDPEIEIIENYEDIGQHLSNNTTIFFIDNYLKLQNQTSSIIGTFTRKYKNEIKLNRLNIFLLSPDKKNFEGLAHFNDNVVEVHCGNSSHYYEGMILKHLNQLSINNPIYRKEIKFKPKMYFVHGFNGNKSTWNQMIKLIKSDDDFKDIYDLDFFNYPTFTFSLIKLFKLFVPRKYDTLEANAKSLNTLIEMETSKNITLVGHSLGGLIIRTFLIKHFASHSKKIKKVLLYAPANNGSKLATSLSKIYRKNIHLRILVKGNNELLNLNESWTKSGIEERIYIKAIIGLRDKTVAIDSSTLGLKESNIETFVDRNHLDIKCPGTKDSNIYKNFKKHLKHYA